MEKVQTLLWIVLAIGAFVYRMVQKMRATSAQEQRERPRAPASPALPAATFQELLKQMQARNTAETGTPALPATGLGPSPNTLAGRPVPRPTVPQPRSQERTAPRRNSSEALVVARPINRPAPAVQRGASLPRAVIAAQVDATYRPFAPAKPAAEPTGAVVRRLLAQPANVRAAFVLGEILSRRPW